MDALKKLGTKLGAAVLALAMSTTAIADTITYFHNDISGSPLAATDSAGSLLWKENYKPYGEKLTKSTASADNKIGFHGKAHDDGTGLSYLGARYYDPVVGRFMGADPVGFQEDNVHSFNRYTYTNNNPYKYVDPDGQYADLVIEAASLTLGLLSFRENTASGNYTAAAVDGAGIVADSILSVIPFAPGAAGLAINAARGLNKGSEAVTQSRKTLTLQQQAADLVPLNGNKHRVTLRSENSRMDVDLAGASHRGIETPHTKISPRNFKAPDHMQPAYNTTEKRATVSPTTQQDIRTVRRFLERQ